MPVKYSVLNVLVGAFNQEKALVGAFSVILKPGVEPMDRVTALIVTGQAAQFLYPLVEEINYHRKVR